MIRPGGCQWLIISHQYYCCPGAGIAGYGKFSVVILVQLFLLSLQQASSSGIYQVMYARFDAPVQKKYTNGLFYQQVLLYTGIAILGYAIHWLVPGAVEAYASFFMRRWPQRFYTWRRIFCVRYC